MVDKDNKNNQRLLGTLRISNMIPVPVTEITPYFVKEEKDENYKNLILSELRFIQRNAKKIIKNANVLYYQKCNNFNYPYVKNSLDFKKLEGKCLEYIKQKQN